MAGIAQAGRMPMFDMRRREFITLLGGAAVWSSVGGAQTARERAIIGTLIQGTPIQNKGLRFRQSFFDGLRELGDIEGRDFDVVIQPARSTSELPKAAEQLALLNPDVILAAASATALAAKQATSTIPIVVAAWGNPVALGLAASDSRHPSGNLTGIMPYVQGLPAKQLEFAREIVPGARKIGIVNDTSDIKATPQWDEINAVASKFEVTIVGADARRPDDIDPTFRKFKAEGVDVVIVLQASGERHCTRRQAGNINNPHRPCSIGKPGRARIGSKRFPPQPARELSVF